MPNSTAEQLRNMQLWAGGLCLLSLLCIVVGIVLMGKDRSRHAAVVAFLPTTVIGLIFLALLL